MKKVVVSAVVAGILAVGASAFDLGDVANGLNKVTKEVGKAQEKSKAEADEKAFKAIFDKQVAECQSFYRKNKIVVRAVLNVNELYRQLEKTQSEPKEYDQYKKEYNVAKQVNEEIGGKPLKDLDIKKYTTNKNKLFGKQACLYVFNHQEKKYFDEYEKFADETSKYE